MSEDEKRKWAKKFLAGLEKVKEKAESDERATASYWNCDDWGSISGMRDAEEWVENQLINYVIEKVSKHVDKYVDKIAERHERRYHNSTPAIKGIDQE